MLRAVRLHCACSGLLLPRLAVFWYQTFHHFCCACCPFCSLWGAGLHQCIAFGTRAGSGRVTGSRHAAGSALSPPWTAAAPTFPTFNPRCKSPVFGLSSPLVSRGTGGINMLFSVPGVLHLAVIIVGFTSLCMPVVTARFYYSIKLAFECSNIVDCVRL